MRRELGIAYRWYIRLDSPFDGKAYSFNGKVISVWTLRELKSLIKEGIFKEIPRAELALIIN